MARVLEGEARAEAGLDHARAGDLVLLAERDAWFAYPYWLDERRAPDFARTVDIHRKPGYDPLRAVRQSAPPLPQAEGRARAAAGRRSGFRYRMDVIPLDPALVKGSHGVPPADPEDGPVLIAGGRRDRRPLPARPEGARPGADGAGLTQDRRNRGQAPNRCLSSPWGPYWGIGLVGR